MSDQEERSQYPPDAQHTVRIRRESRSSPRIRRESTCVFVFESLRVYSGWPLCFRASLLYPWFRARRTLMSADTPLPQPTTIQQLASAVYPSFAMLAGMQLDVFTPLKDGPLTAAQLADMLGVNMEKLSRLLYALVIAGL